MPLTGSTLARLLASGARRLAAYREELNAINVFPAPDGDTGDNLVATASAASHALEQSSQPHLGRAAAAAADAAFQEARGNSGLILSQILKGFAQAFSDLTEADTRQVADAFRRGKDAAYAAMVRPVEGTMLTVIRECGERATQLAAAASTLEEFLAAMVRTAQQAVDRTPDLLPALRRVGVVDAGAQGLAYFLEGMWEALIDRPLPLRTPASTQNPHTLPPLTAHPYDLELSLRLRQPHGAVLDALAAQAESVVFTAGPEFVRIHLHADDPATVLRLCMEQGTLVEARIRDMREQRAELLRRFEEEPLPLRKAKVDAAAVRTPVIVLAAGEGFAALFRSLGAARVLDAAQANLDSLQAAIGEAGTEEVILLPNDPALLHLCLLAQERAIAPVRVLPTRTQPEGVAALLAWRPHAGAEENFLRMAQATQSVRTGIVTSSGMGFRGVAGEREVTVSASLGEAALAVLRKLRETGGEVITLYPGSGVEPAEVEKLVAEARREFLDATVEVVSGGQLEPSLILSVE
jgi:DAK2 domain fusion protein YloV